MTRAEDYNADDAEKIWTKVDLPSKRWWSPSSKGGGTPMFDHPDPLEEKCLEYFEWVHNNPLKEAKAFSYEGDVTLASVPKMRAMTLTGLCLFLGISRHTWYKWQVRSADENDTDFVLRDVVEWANLIIQEQKFTGAAADLLNANFIARDLGLADKKEHTSPDGSMTPKTRVNLSDLTDEELDELERLTNKVRD